MPSKVGTMVELMVVAILYVNTASLIRKTSPVVLNVEGSDGVWMRTVPPTYTAKNPVDRIVCIFCNIQGVFTQSNDIPVVIPVLLRLAVVATFKSVDSK